MPMSTKIEDLPMEDEYDENDMYMEDYGNQAPGMYEEVPSESNVKMNVKKRVQFDEQVSTIEPKMDFWNIIKSEINEENALVLILLYLGSLSIVTKQLQRIPALAKVNEFLLNILKVIVLFIIYLVLRRFVLPHIKL